MENKAKSLWLYEVLYWKNDGYLIGSYQYNITYHRKAIVALSLSNILIFEISSKNPEKLKLVKIICKESIKSIKRKKIKNDLEICFSLQNPKKKVSLI